MPGRGRDDRGRPGPCWVAQVFVDDAPQPSASPADPVVRRTAGAAARCPLPAGSCPRRDRPATRRRGTPPAVPRRPRSAVRPSRRRRNSGVPTISSSRRICVGCAIWMRSATCVNVPTTATATRRCRSSTSCGAESDSTSGIAMAESRCDADQAFATLTGHQATAISSSATQPPRSSHGLAGGHRPIQQNETWPDGAERQLSGRIEG
jgi:hypothetical protein